MHLRGVSYQPGTPRLLSEEERGTNKNPDGAKYLTCIILQLGPFDASKSAPTLLRGQWYLVNEDLSLSRLVPSGPKRSQAVPNSP